MLHVWAECWHYQPRSRPHSRLTPLQTRAQATGPGQLVDAARLTANVLVGVPRGGWECSSEPRQAEDDAQQRKNVR